MVRIWYLPMGAAERYPTPGLQSVNITEGAARVALARDSAATSVLSCSKAIAFCSLRESPSLIRYVLGV